MNRRERLLAIILGGAVGVFAFYKGVHYVFIDPLQRAEGDLVHLERENTRLDAVLASRRNLARRWNNYAGRTLGFDRAEISNRFATSLKAIAKQHGFEDAMFSPTAGTRIAGKTKTDIVTVAYRVGVEGPYVQAMAFLRDIYRTPYLSQITKLSLIPMSQRGGDRNTVRMQLTVETPMLPTIDPRQIPEAALARCMPADETAPTDPARDYLPPDDQYALFAKRNIFKPYVPPPTNVVLIENKDWKTAVATVRFQWEGEEKETKVETIPARGQATVKGSGDVAEIEGRYADGVSFGPRRLDFNQKKDWTFAIATHHPEPPAETVRVVVENQDKEPVDVELVLTTKDGQTKKYPPMRFAAGQRVLVDEFEVKSVALAGVYASGKKAQPAVLMPRAGDQVYLIPPEPAQPVAQVTSDPPPNGEYTVTGLVTYPGQQELIASGPGGASRVVVPAGEEGEMDGGTLLGVHPLGGVVRMPSGNFYLYPFGRNFTERVQLSAASIEELPQAIDAASEMLASLSPVVPNGGAAATEGAPSANRTRPLQGAGRTRDSRRSPPARSRSGDSRGARQGAKR